MAYYLLTVLQQDDGVEVQRLVKDLIRNRVSGCGLALKKLFCALSPASDESPNTKAEKPQHRKGGLIEICLSRPAP